MKSIFLFIVTLYINTNIIAQDKESEYFDSVDYIACKIADAYTNQYISNGKPEKYSDSEFNKEKKSFNTVISEKLTDINFESHLVSSELILLLSKNNFNDFSKKLDKAIKNTKDKFNDDFSKDKSINMLFSIFNDDNVKDIVSKYSKVKSLENSLKEEIKNSLLSFEDSKEEKVKNKKENISPNLKEIVKEVDKEKPLKKINWLSWFFIALSFTIAILSFLYSFFNHKKQSERIDRHRKEIDELKQKLFANIQKINTLNKLLNDKISEQNDAIKNIQSNKGNEFKDKQVLKKNINNESIQNNNQDSKKSLICFAKNPLEDGSFNASSVNEEKNQKFYKFTIDSNDSNKAEFEFYNTDYSLKVSLNSPESYLYRVCENINELNQNASKIITKPGIAIKQGDKWVVTKKAKISYE